jgi:hypothetical protein
MFSALRLPLRLYNSLSRAPACDLSSFKLLFYPKQTSAASYSHSASTTCVLGIPQSAVTFDFPQLHHIYQHSSPAAVIMAE